MCQFIIHFLKWSINYKLYQFRPSTFKRKSILSSQVDLILMLLIKEELQIHEQYWKKKPVYTKDNNENWSVKKKNSIIIFTCMWQWDILSNGGVVQEMAHIANGRDTGNCVSLLRVNVSLTVKFSQLILFNYHMVLHILKYPI